MMRRSLNISLFFLTFSGKGSDTKPCRNSLLSSAAIPDTQRCKQMRTVRCLLFRGRTRSVDVPIATAHYPETIKEEEVITYFERSLFPLSPLFLSSSLSIPPPPLPFTIIAPKQAIPLRLLLAPALLSSKHPVSEWRPIQSLSLLEQASPG